MVVISNLFFKFLKIQWPIENFYGRTAFARYIVTYVFSTNETTCGRTYGSLSAVPPRRKLSLAYHCKGTGFRKQGKIITLAVINLRKTIVQHNALLILLSFKNFDGNTKKLIKTLVH